MITKRFLFLALIALFVVGLPAFPYSSLAQTTYVLSGTVYDKAGATVPGVVVEAYSGSTGILAAADTTDSQGLFSLVLEPGSYDLTVKPPPEAGFEESSIEGVVVAGDTVYNIVLVPRAIQLSGIVRTSNGVIIPRAQVRVIPSSGGIEYQDYADASGYYQVSLVPGTYSVLVSRSWDTSDLGNIPYYLSSTVKTGLAIADDMELDLVVNVVKLSGIVQTTSDAPVPSVLLLGNDPWGGRATTGSNGRYTMAVTPGTYNIKIVPPEGSGFANDLRSGINVPVDTTLDIVLQQAIELSGIVRTSNGVIIPRAQVRVIPSSGGIEYQDYADASGYYQVSLVPGTYSVLVSRSWDTSDLGNIPYYLSSTVKTGLAIADDMELDLVVNVVKLSGIVQTTSGAPVPGVVLSGNDPWGGRATTLSDGRYTMALTPGTYNIKIVPPEGSGFAPVSIPGVLVDTDANLSALLEGLSITLKLNNHNLYNPFEVMQIQVEVTDEEGNQVYPALPKGGTEVTIDGSDVTLWCEVNSEEGSIKVHAPTEIGSHTVRVRVETAQGTASDTQAFKVERVPVLLVHGYHFFPSLQMDLQEWEAMAEELTGNGVDNDNATFYKDNGFWKLSRDDGKFDVYVSNYAGEESREHSDIRQYAERLAWEISKVREDSGVERVDIVAHSMGGLVSRAYVESEDLEFLGGYQGPQYRDDVRNLIVLGTPNHGISVATLLYMAKNGWDVLPEATDVLWNCALEPNGLGCAMAIADYYTAVKKAAEENGYSSLAQMMPVPPVSEEAYSEFLVALNSGQTGEQLGVKYSTIAGDVYDQPAIPSWDPREWCLPCAALAGDQYVLTESVALDEAAPEDRNKVLTLDHGQLKFDRAVFDQVEAWLLGGEIEGPLVDSVPDRIAFCSPVHVTVVDGNGYIANDEGTNTIPGAHVSVEGEEKIFYIPSNLAYSVKAVAYDAGGVGIVQGFVDAMRARHMAFFDSIAVTTNTTISFDKLPGETECPLSIDYDGDGTVDEVRFAAASGVASYLWMDILADGETLEGDQHTGIIELRDGETSNLTVCMRNSGDATLHNVQVVVDGGVAESIGTLGAREEKLVPIQFTPTTIGLTRLDVAVVSDEMQTSLARSVFVHRIDLVLSVEKTEYRVNELVPILISTMNEVQDVRLVEVKIRLDISGPLTQTFEIPLLSLGPLVTQNTVFAWDTNGVACGTYTIEGTLLLEDREMTSDVTTVSLVGQEPVADPGGPYLGDEASPMTFDASGSYDPDGTIVSYQWDFGDGSPVADGQTPTHTYEESGVYTVTLTVTDDDGLTSVATATVTVNITTFTIDASAGPGGTIAPFGAVVVDFGTDRTFTITPGIGYHVADVLVDGGSVGAVTNYPFTAVSADHTINATFVQNQYSLMTAVVGKGSVSRDPDLATCIHGTEVTLSAKASPGWTFVGWSGDLSGNSNPAVITMDGNKVITASFAVKTKTLLCTAPNPSAYGQQVTFVAIVLPMTWCSSMPTGTVTFKDAGVTLGTGNLNAWGVATFSTSAISLGKHSITATYEGGLRFNGSTSSALSQNVKACTTVKVVSSTNPSVYGQSVTFTATVVAKEPGTGVPAGKVTFKDGCRTLGTGTLDVAGHATYSTSSLYVGVHSITAVYGGDDNFCWSASSVLTQNVKWR